MASSIFTLPIIFSFYPFLEPYPTDSGKSPEHFELSSDLAEYSDKLGSRKLNLSPCTNLPYQQLEWKCISWFSSSSSKKTKATTCAFVCRDLIIHFVSTIMDINYGRLISGSRPAPFQQRSCGLPGWHLPVSQSQDLVVCCVKWPRGERGRGELLAVTTNWNRTGLTLFVYIFHWTFFWGQIIHSLEPSF